MAEYSRPKGFRFAFKGVNTRSTPDSLPPDKYPAAVNIRTTSDNSIRTRPGYVPLFNTGYGIGITDIAAYAAIETDDLPRFLARDQDNHIVLDNGVTATILAGPFGGGVSMLPFRPSASPQSWMYIAGPGDYQKVSAPDGGSVTPAKVGIAEVTDPVDAGVQAPQWTDLSNIAAGWTASGTAGAVTDVNVLADTVGSAIYPDPVIPTRYSVPTADAALYLTGMLLVFSRSAPGNFKVPVQDVLPAAVTVPGVTIKAIRYDLGVSGHCIVVPNQFPQQVINLRRGCLLTLGVGAPNSETVLVLDVIFGNQEKVAFECVTLFTHSNGESILGVACVIVDGIDATVIGQPVNSPDLSSSITTGIGNLSQALPSKPFQKVFTNSGANTLIPQADDYIHLFLQVTDPTLITTLKIIFNTGAVVDYTTSVLSYTVTGASLVNQNPSNLIEIMFPISALTAEGITVPDISPANGVQLQVTTTGSVSFFWGMFWVGGGGAPDVGANGAPYQYRIKPRSSLTGATGNPSPVMRYGVSPRRQNVAIPLPAQYEIDMDLFDVYRYGGTVTSYRYIGTASPSSVFVDQYFDDTAVAGKLLVTDDFEPWPSIDVPFSVYTGGGDLVQVIGTEIVVTLITSPWPANILKWLPGTLIIIGGLQTFTLRARPTQIDLTTYLFEVEENGGYNATAISFIVNEPIVARQFAPYMWGPDAYGVFYAAGEPLRPGGVYFSKPYSPDTTNQNIVELVPPSEPIIGGEILNGVSLAATSSRWWSLYPNFTNAGAYTPLSISVGRGLAAPLGICSDGERVYFWAKDCIAWMAGAGFTSLTDDDLFNLFPHDGVTGQDTIRNGITFYAPDYSRANAFRLSVVNKYLYASYQDSTGGPHTLVCDLRTGAWMMDAYHDQMTVQIGIGQQQGSLGSGPSTLYPTIVMGDRLGFVWKQQDNHNDNNSPITAVVGTFEWDGGDMRAGMEWGDQYLDCLAPSGLSAQPMSLQAPLGAATAIPVNASRQFNPVSLGGQTLQKFLGLRLTWTDNFTSQAQSTTLYIWQSALVPKPEVIIDRVGDWENGGGAKYYRGIVLEADTFGLNKGFGIRNNDNNALVALTINFDGQDDQAFSFVPFVGHLVRYEPTADGKLMRYFGIKWIFDDWPELIALYSAWFNMGVNSAKYLRGAVVPMDTNGQPISLDFISSDGGVITVGPFTTPAAEKTNVPMAFVIPLIGHSFQIRPSGPVRIWYEEIRWEFDQWPELISEATGWLKVAPGSGASFLQGMIIPIETLGAVPAIDLLTDDGSVIPLLATVTPLANIKTPVPYSLSIPKVVHEIQLRPTAPVRIWLEEIQWIAEPTPELATTWTTQASALESGTAGMGSNGYKHIPRIDAAYASTAPVTLTITAFDGISPAPIILPPTGGVYQKFLVTLTPNKGMLFTFSGTSPGTFQIFLNDFGVWVGDWNRQGPYRLYRNLGGQFGDTARI